MPILDLTTVARRALALAALLSALGMTGCAEQPVANSNLPAAGPTAPAVTMSITFCPNSDSVCAPASTFSLKALRDLNIIVHWGNLPQGVHLQTLDVLLPDGGVYQTYESTFEVTDSTGDTITIAKPIRIVGTWVRQRKVLGNWQAQVSLDGELMGNQGIQLSQ